MYKKKKKIADFVMTAKCLKRRMLLAGGGILRFRIFANDVNRYHALSNCDCELHDSELSSTSQETNRCFIWFEMTKCIYLVNQFTKCGKK